MSQPRHKSTVAEIRARFDADVDRFSNLETGQSAAIDAPLALDLIAGAAAAVNPGARRLLDVGCGAGNYALKLLSAIPGMDVDLLDLSRPMLDRAVERVGAATGGRVRAFQVDVREMALEPASYDVVTAAATLHHLRDDSEWEAVFGAVFRALRPGGSFWISDLVEHSVPQVQALMLRRYADYLQAVGGDAYRDHVLDYVDREDTPRPLVFQLDLLRRVGFGTVDVLHKKSTFAAFGGVKDAPRRG